MSENKFRVDFSSKPTGGAHTQQINGGFAKKISSTSFKRHINNRRSASFALSLSSNSRSALVPSWQSKQATESSKGREALAMATRAGWWTPVVALGSQATYNSRQEALAETSGSEPCDHTIRVEYSIVQHNTVQYSTCLLYTSPSPRD